MMKSIAKAALVGLSLLVSTNASAITISIDPGNVGDMFSGRTYSFDDLNGTSISGTALDLDFVFADMKHIEATSTGALIAQVTLTSDLGTFTGFGDNPTGFLSDEFGNSILDHTGFGLSKGGDEDTYFFQVSFDQVLDGFIFHDIHISVVLPVISSPAVIEAAQIQLFLDNEPPDILKVGEWTAVLEPGTLALFGLGLVGLGIARRRRMI